MRRVPRRPIAALALALVLAAASGPARAEDPAPPKKPVPTRKPVVEFPGVRWERDFPEGRRRAAREGRPVLFAVNALVDDGEPGNLAAARGSYPSKDMGEGSRPWVCFVCNAKDHEERTLADDSKVCGRYGWGTCACHKEALSWLLRRHAPDGESVVSPSHWAFEPDGALFWHEDYVQGTPDGARLEAMTAVVSPRLAMRRVWTTREARLAALAKTPAAGLEKAARDWLAEGDVLAATGLVAALDQEGDAARRKALFAALVVAKDAGPLLFDSVDAATSTPDADPEAALAWTELARVVDPRLAAYAFGRILVRSKDPALDTKAIRLFTSGLDHLSLEVGPPLLRATYAEAALLRGDATAEKLVGPEVAGALPAARLRRARRAAGLVKGEAEDWWHDRAAILRASPERARKAADELRLLLEKKSVPTDVKVAAAIALRRAGDATGVPVLLWAIADGVEGPEARFELAKDAGEDLGDEPSAWEGWLRGGGGAGAGNAGDGGGGGK